MCVAHDDVRHAVRFDSGLLHSLIGRKEIAEAVFVNPFLAVAAAVEENRAAASLNHPKNHRDIDRLILGCAGDEFGKGKLREVRVTDGSDRVIWFCGRL